MPKCKTRNDRPECDNRVAKRQMEGEKLRYPTYSVCAACMEGVRTRAYIRKILGSERGI